MAAIAFASRLAPTKDRGGHKFCDHHQSPVGASLLAKAVFQAPLMLNVLASSRASFAPTD
ncbi:hypothetical protein DKY63_12430 [Pseudomonas putida]|uniref:Uncharacterized protein n=1 Tax=Pseudomonas putida TaxID=303 RepID=A0A2Z4RIC0_PSEPU|nr:hypothetical protein DKY63_12430 [Pseudomonas putida]